MSFRIRIVLMTMALMTLLFSVGGTALIHSSFQTSLEKEEQSVVSMNEMILRVVQHGGKARREYYVAKRISRAERDVYGSFYS